MNFKGLFKDSHFLIQLFLILVVIFTGAFIFSFIGMLVIFIKSGFSMELLTGVMESGGLMDYPDYARELQFFASLGTFILPAIALAYIYSDNYKEYLQIDQPISLSITLWTIVSMVVLLPFMNYIAYLNQQMVFPESLKWLEDMMRAAEEANGKIIEAILMTDSLWGFILNIVVVAIFAGVGEEFMFRGVLQNVFKKAIRNEHIVIWSVAIIFSAIHFQFYGFIPRMLLGAYFGYVLYYTRNMWMAVLAHLTHNLMGVVAAYTLQDDPAKMEELDAIGLGSTTWMAAVSVVLWAFAFWQIKRKGMSQNLSS